MSELSWADVDSYLESALVAEDPVLRQAQQAAADAGLPAISVSPLQGKFLHVIARLMGARRVLEIGSLGGYSAIWLGRALPADGRLYTLELSPHHARVATANIAAAGLSDRVEVMVGPALSTLARLAEDPGPGSFDLTFIDADKPNNPAYFSWALRLTRPGGAIVVDNVVRKGRVADPGSDDPNVIGTQRLFDLMADHPGITASAVQTVGTKGHDGFAIAFVEPSGAAPEGG
jgi:predicted O-methyltransferase YrrM